LLIGLNKNKELILNWKNHVYTYQQNQFTYLFDIDMPETYQKFLSVEISGDYIVWRGGKKSACARSLLTNKIHCFEYPENALRFSMPGNGTIAINTPDGSFIYNPVTQKTDYHFLNNISVSKVLIDHEGTWWFTTLGEGVYQLLSTEYKNFKPWKDGTNQEIFSLAKMGNKLVMGTNFGQLLYTDDFKSTHPVSLPSAIQNNYNRINCLYVTPTGKLVVGTDKMIALLNKDFKLEQKSETTSTKYIYYKNDDSVYVATSIQARLMSLKDLKHYKIIWNERATAITLYKNTLFVGTLNGLYHLPPQQLPVFMGEYDSLFSKRISSMVVSRDTTLWVATYDGGIIGMKKGAIKYTFTTKDGLSSDICRNLTIDDDVLWIGTDKGVTRIDLKQQPFRITTFSVNDGLLSNHVNAIYKEGDTVFVASQDGITYFDLKKINNVSHCNLELTGVSQGGNELPLMGTYVFDHTHNNVKVEFAGISFKSTGDIMYQYKLNGMDSVFKTTRETALEFLSLPPGTYELELMAINKFGVKSEVKKIKITITPAYYQTTWFYILAVVTTAAVTLIFVTLYNRNKQKREQQDRATMKRIADLEQMALRAQMNPHFIFNCLNSIQQFVYDKDIQSANRFISGFAKLIRQTLDNSTKTTLSVADEIQYLNSFLALEQIRFENKFDYHIIVDEGINTEEYKIPVMLLQPQVENSVRHGIRYKKEANGIITIRFSLIENELVCAIEDNGIGRKKAMELKSRQHIEYHSKGMLLTSERIEAMNKVSVDKIRMEVVDLTDKQGQAAGTKIIIHFPLSLVQNK
jgi:ligand-binding sensor domain-containing protein